MSTGNNNTDGEQLPLKQQHYGTHEAEYFDLLNESNHRIPRVVLISFLISISVLFVLLLVGIVVLVVQYVQHHKNRSIDLNIHLKLSPQCSTLAIQMNQNISAHDSAHQQIDLENKQEPHITLYLSSFGRINLYSIEKALRQLFQQNLNVNDFDDIQMPYLPCTVEIEPVIFASGNYVLWQVKNDACIQSLSDAIVNSTSQYLSPNAKTTIPAWINTLPPEIRQLKIDMIHKYGSPNVFSQFEPHVTLAWSSSNDTVLSDIVQKYVAHVSCTKR
jgi:hypothetical protein